MRSLTAFAASMLAALALALPAPAHAQAAARLLPSGGFADLAERLSPAVVNIATSQNISGGRDVPRYPRGSPLERFNDNGDGAAPQINSLGSGFIIAPNGVVVTNNHVIEGADTIEVVLASGERMPAEIVGRDMATDLAVLRVRAHAPLPSVPWGNSDQARVGDLVIAIGNPFGLGGTVTLGIVSARNRNIDAGRYDDFIQTDAAINRGNSGGPLFNMQGEVIGVNTAIVSPTGGSVGVGFAMPTTLVRPVVDQILRFGEARRGWFGVRLTPVTPEIAERNNLPRVAGAVVTRVTPGGPAAAAGIRPGDIVVNFDGRDVADTRALTRMVADAPIGKTVAIRLLRGGRTVSVNARIERLDEGQLASAAQPDAAEPTPGPGARLTSGRVLGVSLAELNNDVRRRYDIAGAVSGLVVTAIDPLSDAHNKLEVGDVVVEMAFQEVDTVGEARALADRAEAAGRPLLVHVNRGGDMTFRSLRTRR
ncbi:MAG: Do family serine endopeptidase [Hyphomonadaceae bacterium]|nr:Do family serine endopeptidase [Hyphomonadaceae bacterium]